MPEKDFNRNSILSRGDGTYHAPPFVRLPENLSDKFIRWNPDLNRMDLLSQKYYKNPFYDFLILYANPEYLNEFDIPQGALIRIPFPLNKAISDYSNALNNYLRNNV
ncbi:MAG: hypothetical protein ACOC2W_03940 [bacterium]